MTTIRALSIRQPWAHAIAFWGKNVENRGHRFTRRYRGPLLIHASGSWSKRGGTDARVTGIAAQRLPSGLRRDFADRMNPEWFDFGAVVAVADLTDAHTGYRCCEPWGDDVYETPNGTGTVTHLVLANTRPLPEPVPCRGALGLWTPPDDVLDAVTTQIGPLT